MHHAWEYVVKAAQNLHAQGHLKLTRTQIVQEALRLGWPLEPVTLATHVSGHMRSDRKKATHPYLDRVSHNAYRLNEVGRRVGQGL